MTSSLFSYFGPRPIPARIGTRRHTIVVASLYGRSTKLSFSCCSDQLPGHTHSNIAEAFKASKIINSFRRSLFDHGINHAEGRTICLTPNVSKTTHRVTGTT